MQHDLYKTLGVKSTATEEEIKRAFRSLALRHHPDRNQGTREAEEHFKEVNYAYSILGNPERRKRYDIYRKIFPPQILEKEYMLAQKQIFEKLFLNQDFGAMVDQLYRAAEYPFLLWKERLSRFQERYSKGFTTWGPWWLIIPFLPVKVAGMAGRYLSERLPRRLGRNFSSSRRGGTRKHTASLLRPGDIEMLLPLTKRELQEGTSLKVSFVRNEEWVRLKVKVPPGLQPGIRLRLRHKGNAVSGINARGDLYLKIAVNT